MKLAEVITAAVILLIVVLVGTVVVTEQNQQIEECRQDPDCNITRTFGTTGPHTLSHYEKSPIPNLIMATVAGSLALFLLVVRTPGRCTICNTRMNVIKKQPPHFCGSCRSIE